MRRALFNFALVLWLTSSAQGLSPGTGTSIDSHEILVTAPRELNEFSQGKSTSVIYPERLPKSVVSVKDLVELNAGVYVSQGTQAGAEESVSIRGFSSRQVRILIDGIPLDDGGSSSVNLAGIPTSQIEKIIVSRGPQSAQFGNGAMGGVINIITKQDIRQSKLTAGYGSRESLRAAGETYQAISPGKISLSAYADRSKGLFTIQNPFTTPLHDPNPSQTLNVGNNHTTEAGGEAGLRLHRQIVPLLASISYGYRDKGIPGILGQSYAQVSEGTHSAKARVAIQPLSIGTLAPESELVSYVSLHDRNYQDPAGERDGFAENYTRRAWGTGAYWKPTFLLDDRTSAPTRLSWDSESFQDSNLRAERHQISLSARLDYAPFEGSLLLSPSAQISKATAFNAKLSYGFGVSYQPLSFLTIKSSINTGFRYPTFDELYLSRGIFVGNPELTAEETLGGDIGVEIKGRSASLEASYFLYRTDNLIEYLLVSGFQYKPFNYSRALTEGVEVTAKWEPVIWLSLSGTATLQNVLDKGEGSDSFDHFVPGRPRLYGAQGLELKPVKGVTVFNEVGTALERYVNKANSKRLLDRYEWNTGVKIEPGESLTVTLEARNLLDRNNVDVRGFPLPGRAYHATVTKVF